MLLTEMICPYAQHCSTEARDVATPVPNGHLLARKRYQDSNRQLSFIGCVMLVLKQIFGADASLCCSGRQRLRCYVEFKLCLQNIPAKRKQ